MSPYNSVSEQTQALRAERELTVNLQAENDELKNKLAYIRKRYPEIEAMEQALKG